MNVESSDTITRTGQYNTRLDKHAPPTPITSSLHHSTTLVRRRQEAGLDRWVTVLEALTSAALDTTSNELSDTPGSRSRLPQSDRFTRRHITRVQIHTTASRLRQMSEPAKLNPHTSHQFSTSLSPQGSLTNRCNFSLLSHCFGNRSDAGTGPVRCGG